MPLAPTIKHNVPRLELRSRRKRSQERFTRRDPSCAGEAEPNYGQEFRILLSHDDVGLAQELLTKNDERLRHVLDATKTLIWEAEADTFRFTYVSKQAKEILGYPIAQWYEPDFLTSHIHGDDAQRALSFLRKHCELEGHYNLTFRMTASDERVIWLQSVIEVTHEKGKPATMSGCMIDISERMRAEDAVREIGGRLIAAQEEEGRRVARELHDDLSQRMAILSIELEQLGNVVKKPDDIRQRLQVLQTQAQEIASDIHRLSYKLHPSKLEHVGLDAAVESLCRELSTDQKFKIEFRQKGFPATLAVDVTLCLFRIVQEALRNCIRHSRAQAVEVVLEKTPADIHLSVSDNGCGFDMESSSTRKGLGLVSMRERVRLVEGEIQVNSEAQGGTRIDVRVPMKCGVNMSPPIDLVNTVDLDGSRAPRSKSGGEHESPAHSIGRRP